MYKPPIFVFMETRCDPTKLYNSIKRLGFDEVIFMENNGFYGGIIVAWRTDFMSVQLCEKGDQYILIKVGYQ